MRCEWWHCWLVAALYVNSQVSQEWGGNYPSSDLHFFSIVRWQPLASCKYIWLQWLKVISSIITLEYSILPREKGNFNLNLNTEAFRFLVFNIFLLVLRLQIRIFHQKIDDWKSVNHYFKEKKSYSDNVWVVLRMLKLKPFLSYICCPRCSYVFL